MLRGTIVNHTDMHGGWSKKGQMPNFFQFRICLQQIWKMGAFHVQRTMMKKGYFCNFEIEDNGKSPLHVLHKRMKCESFIFLFTHHSYIQTVMYWSMATLMIKRLKCSLNPKCSHCLTFQLSPIRTPQSQLSECQNMLQFHFPYYWWYATFLYSKGNVSTLFPTQSYLVECQNTL